MRDQELIHRVVENRPGAFDELYHAYVDRVHRHLFTIVGPDPDLDDLLQQTFVQVFRSIGAYRFEASFATWLHRVTLNVALGHLRRRSVARRRAAEESALAELPSPEQPDEAFSNREKLVLLHSLLARMHEKKRVAFLLYEVGGHTLEETAELTDAPLPTVAARVRAARQELKKALERRMRGSHAAVA